MFQLLLTLVKRGRVLLWTASHAAAEHLSDTYRRSMDAASCWVHHWQRCLAWHVPQSLLTRQLQAMQVEAHSDEIFSL
jgi:hypothetical protein